jgi:hypothetical protein
MPIGTAHAALRFIERHGVVLESARGRVPNLAQEIAGQPIHGSRWAHPKSHEIYQLLEKTRDSTEVLMCRLVGGKITFVHRRLWPALVAIAEKFDRARLAAIREEHTPSGAHRAIATEFSRWDPEEAMRLAKNLSAEAAENELAAIVAPR